MTLNIWNNIIVEQAYGVSTPPFVALHGILNSRDLRDFVFVDKKLSKGAIILTFLKYMPITVEGLTRDGREKVLTMVLRGEKVRVRSKFLDYSETYDIHDMRLKDDVLLLLHKSLPNRFSAELELL
jgi:hypothetical protein